ncbi:hypothetical protein IU501_36210, partial [Nocardia otitidiscaviarum]|nr:hypothetical protein [Nocardia otitidiscaviarum]
LQPGFNGCFHLDRWWWLALEERANPVAEAANVTFQSSEEFAGSHEVLPASQYFSAQEGAVTGGLGDPRRGVREGSLDVFAQLASGVVLVLDSLG